MTELNKNQTATQRKSHVSEAANTLLNEGKKLAQEVYEDGINKVSEAEANVKEYSDQLVKKVQENPVSSILIAAGVGFLLSKIFHK
ncbi:MAG: hypothetical protein EPN84_02655 [Legionella sp.]|nr:MAG: hypothetical protein EPN84_02655 [Legionella sp.]